MKIRKIYFYLCFLFPIYSACVPEVIEWEENPFNVYMLDSRENPPVSVHPVNGTKKTLALFASCPGDSIVQLIVSGASQPFEIDPVVFRLVDPENPPTLDEDGYLSRPLSTVIFEINVNVPKTFNQGTYSVNFTVVNGRGDKKDLTASFEAVNYFMPATRLSAYNGQTVSNNVQYLPTANCFLGFTKVFSYPVDNTVSPARRDTVLASVTPIVRTPSLARNLANRPNIYAHIYTDIPSLDSRQMYLVSPDESWIADSLATLNNSTAFPTHLMNRVRYIDLGLIDFLNISSEQMSEFSRLPFETEGKAMVPLKAGHSYAFLSTDQKVVVLFVKAIIQYAAFYSTASPTADFHMIVQH